MDTYTQLSHVIPKKIENLKYIPMKIKKKCCFIFFEMTIYTVYMFIDPTSLLRWDLPKQEWRILRDPTTAKNDQ